jgi:hypothetical protein
MKKLVYIFIPILLIILVLQFPLSASNADNSNTAPESPFSIRFINNDSENTFSESSKIGESPLSIVTRFEMWAHAGTTPYWDITGGNPIYMKDIKRDYVNFNELLGDYTLPVEIPLSDNILDIIESGGNIGIVIKTGQGLDINRLLKGGANQQNIEFTVSGDKLILQLPIKLNFLREDEREISKITTLSEVSEKVAAYNNNKSNVLRQNSPGLPVPEYGYGNIAGAVWTRKAPELDLGGQGINYHSGSGIAYAPPYSGAPSIWGPWWLGHLRMSGNDVVLDPIFDNDEVHRSRLVNQGEDYLGKDVAIGRNGAFANMAAIGLFFNFPLEIEFYQTDKNQDLAASVRKSVSSAVPETTVFLDFAVKSTFNTDVETKYVITVDGEEIENEDLEIKLSDENEAIVPFSFPMPNENSVVVFTVNPDGDNPIEENLENNTVEVNIVAAAPISVGGDFTLFYDELEKTVEFDISSTAHLSLPSDGVWTSRSTGNFTISNLSPQIFTDFRVLYKGAWHTGNNIDLSIDEPGGSVTVNATVRATLKRDFVTNGVDNPLNGVFGANDVDRFATGMVSAGGSVSASWQRTVWYEWSEWDDTLKEHVYYSGYSIVPGSSSGVFNPVNAKKDIIIKVYNGRQTVPPPTFSNKIDNNSLFSKKLWWTSKPIIIDVVRIMKYDTIPPKPNAVVDGQYTRTFIEQNTADFTWAINAGLPALYSVDRERASQRNYNRNRDAERAVFASDLSLRTTPYPIRSGYFFNPTGQYSFEVTTEVYKNWAPSNGEPTPEHAAFVKALTESFRYASNMVYLTPSRMAVTIDGSPANRVGTAYPAQEAGIATGVTDYIEFGSYGETNPDENPFFRIFARNDDFDQDIEELTHGYPPASTDPRLKRVMEGYTESGTANDKNYIEYAHEDEEIYKITETTKVTISINPNNTRVFTHVQMRNGFYNTKVYAESINLADVEYVDNDGATYNLTGNNLNTTLPRMTFDSITIRVVGSMYDDAR